MHPGQWPLLYRVLIQLAHSASQLRLLFGPYVDKSSWYRYLFRWLRTNNIHCGGGGGGSASAFSGEGGSEGVGTAVGVGLQHGGTPAC